GERQRVEEVYRLALPSDSPLLRWPEAVRGRDAAALVKLAKEPAFQDLPPAILYILAFKLYRVKEGTAAGQLLRAGLEGRTGDFWLNHQLGMVLLEQQPPRAGEAVRHLTAALALRWDNPGVHLNLGTALKANGDLEGAMRRYQAALQIDPNYAAEAKRA